MATENQRYPLSSPEGTPIPLEVLRPGNFLFKSFNEITASSSIAITEDVNLVLLYSSEDCLVRFGAIAVIPVDGVPISDTFLLAKETYVYVSPPAQSFTVLGLTTTGILRMQELVTWAGIALKTQITKRY